MKKSIIAAGAASVALAAMPVVGAFAAYTGTFTDKIQTTIGETCTFSRGTIADATVTHPTVATESWSTGSGTGIDTLSPVSLTPGATGETEIAESSFKVVCNANVGYKVTVAPTALTLTGATGTQNHPWAYKYNGAVSDAVSYWRIDSVVASPDSKDIANNIVATKNSSTDGTDILVKYYAWAQTGQDAGTYSADAVYTFAAP